MVKGAQVCVYVSVCLSVSVFVCMCVIQRTHSGAASNRAVCVCVCVCFILYILVPRLIEHYVCLCVCVRACNTENTFWCRVLSSPPLSIMRSLAALGYNCFFVSLASLGLVLNHQPKPKCANP